jgi:uncharacterized protein DUF4037
VIENRHGYGLGLARRFYERVIAPRLEDQPHAAALLGPGSEVLGYDDATSTDHSFGPRVQVFVEDPDDVSRTLRRFDDLDGTFEGMPVRFPRYDGDEPSHQVQVHTVAGYFTDWLGVDPAAGMTVADWLVLPTQILGTVTAGAVFRDLGGTLDGCRTALEWYPDDVWRYALAVGWLRIGQEEPFVGRAGARGDDLGSRVLAARLSRDMMRLAFLIERRYPPYSKWFGQAFAELTLAAKLAPLLERALVTGFWRDREAALCEAGRILGEATNDLGLGAPVDPAPRQFHTRDILVPGGERYTVALCTAITDPAMRAVLDHFGYRHGGPVPSLPGTIDQAVDSTDVLSDTSRCRSAASLLGVPAR